MYDEAMLRGKVALVTGSGRGMGHAHAVILAQHGADVVVHDIVPDRVAESAGIVRQHCNRVVEAVADVADPAAMEHMVKRIEKDLGPISILVNNAGIGADRAITEAIDEEMFDRMFDIHVKGTFFTTRAVLPGMKSLGGGAIVNISSIWGMVGHHFGSTYCAAKAAILGFTKSWAKELAPHHITVNAIAPGGVTSPMAIEKDGIDAVRERMAKVPLGRWAEPEEIAQGMLYLVTAGFVTGQVLSLNGGDTIVGI
ncbi:MAG TPA: SDR family oxidoreductase, partial [Ktedonobacterales bacterium]|nr:SDR family oxidoreductase [Ktedonobacterales bacterium]